MGKRRLYWCENNSNNVTFVDTENAILLLNSINLYLTNIDLASKYSAKNLELHMNDSLFFSNNTN